MENSCADIYKADITRTSGVFTIHNRQGQGYHVYCDIHDGYGYTYVSPATRVAVNIADLTEGNNKSHVLIRDRRTNGKQYVAWIEQLSQYASVPLSIQYNAHANYAGFVNGKMSPYIYLGFMPTSRIHKGEVHGYRVNGHDVTYRNCDGNPNSYFVFLFNKNNLAVTSYSTDNALIHKWVDLANEVPSSQNIPSTFFSEYETHFGGCGGFATTHVIPQVTGAALGIRYNIACPTPADIQHGTKRVSGNRMVGSSVTYTCNGGYNMLNGDSTRTCSKTGKWTGSLPFCGQFPCDSQPCQNGGFCFAGPESTYVCECQPEYGGTYCQNRIQGGK
ncbi:uncharacterized protein LOC123559871 isoform X2 [Mercenaria mercenaria]|uniref:uncharacterized protein LOC123559871 isoform X2 n=1 Tax=Mercenaria mercenaria TaxID=6596 RepID=UPI00234F9DF3|nr:uncharacterized protein LOC123559871 isoform X2 [Mercenaria mercenaria]